MGYVTKKAAQRFEEKKAAIYVRVSTQYQVDRASLNEDRRVLSPAGLENRPYQP